MALLCKRLLIPAEVLAPGGFGVRVPPVQAEPAAPGCTELLLQLPRASLLQGDTGDAAHPEVTASPGLSETGLPRSGFCRFELPAENQGNWDVALICNASSGVQRHQKREELPTGRVSGHSSVAAAGTPSPCTRRSRAAVLAPPELSPLSPGQSGCLLAP